MRRWKCTIRHRIRYWNRTDSVIARKNAPFRAFILYLVHWARWLHIGSIIPVKRELTAIALGSRPRRFLTAKAFSWTTAGVDSDILDSKIRCRNARGDSIFRRNVIRSLRERACERCLDFKYSQTRSHICIYTLTCMWLTLMIVNIIFATIKSNEPL